MSDRTWRGAHVVGNGRTLHVAIGSLDVWLTCLRNEWRMAHAEHPDRLIDRCLVDAPAPDVAVPDDASVMRFATDVDDQTITLSAATPDRPVVVRPDPALALVAGAEVTFFVGTAAWVRVSSSHGHLLAELPTARPSDTWFGPDTKSGELCYASRTKARLTAGELGGSAGRVYTQVVMRNETGDVLKVERVQIPSPYLPLYAGDDGILWTPPITMRCKRGVALADLEIGATGPDGTQRVTEPRVIGLPAILVRAFGSLLR